MFRTDNVIYFVFGQEIWEPEAPRNLGPAHDCNVISIHFYLFYTYISIRIESLVQVPYGYYQC